MIDLELLFKAKEAIEKSSGSPIQNPDNVTIEEDENGVIHFIEDGVTRIMMSREAFNKL